MTPPFFIFAQLIANIRHYSAGISKHNVYTESNKFSIKIALLSEV